MNPLMHTTSVPVFTQMLGALSDVLTKAEAHAAAKKIEPSVLLQARLFPDMFALAQQVQVACEFAASVSLVAPLVKDEKTGQPTSLTVNQRPPLESREQVEKMLSACRQRTARLPLVEDAAARTVLGDKWTSTGPLPNWAR